MNVKVIITDGTQPIGNGIGPFLEAMDVMQVLKDDILAPQDLKKKSLMLAGTLLEMTGKYRKGKGLKAAREILESGKALKKMNEIIQMQGKQKKIKIGAYQQIVKTTKIGRVKEIDNEVIAKIARMAGAPQDKCSGLYINKKVHDSIKRGEVLYTIYAENEFKLGLAKEFAKKNNGYLIK